MKHEKMCLAKKSMNKKERRERNTYIRGEKGGKMVASKMLAKLFAMFQRVR